ncbi:MAG TPA: redoxin domain-containing protein [Pirellulales bacterium]|nr:redoxin domain-containing protein [Pirellulales bacterium]
MPSRTISTLLALLAISTARVEPSERRIGDFALTDTNGRTRHLSDWRERRLVVLVFLGVECPLARLYTSRLNELARRFEPRGVQLVGVDANRQDSLADVAQFVREHNLPFPCYKDIGAKVADRFGARRTPEAFVLDQRRVVRYHGRIDDRYLVGVRRDEAKRHDLAVAVEELLAGRPVSVPETEAAGCFIGRAPSAESGGDVTYFGEIAPILQRHCQTCHRPGHVAPFALTGYQDAVDWAETIGEVLEQGRMPPWHADPRHGRFANDPRLSESDQQLVLDWIRHGTPEGDPAEAPPENFSDEWSIGAPDRIVSIPQSFRVPAEGIIEYQRMDVDPGFGEDRWISAAEIRPGNRAVVHHATVFLKPPGGRGPVDQGALGSACLAATAPGTPAMQLPAGMAKLIPAGWQLHFVIHYVAVGSEQSDRTSIGLKFADPATVHKEVATRVILTESMRIPPRIADFRYEKSMTMPVDVLLLSMFPHMHLRGRSFRYEAHYPGGSSEILLDVPRYDFNWQHRYELTEPKRLPAGTRLCCTAHYDNSAANPFNPDSDATVTIGPQSSDEMFNGYFDIALADQDRLSWWFRLSDASPRLARAIMSLAIVVIVWRKVRRRVRLAGTNDGCLTVVPI